MKLLLDENLPHRLRPLLVGHDAFTVAYMKWAGIGNGKLLTKDNGIPYEQNLGLLPCSIVVIEAPSNALKHIRPLIPRILDELKSIAPRSVTRIR